MDMDWVDEDEWACKGLRYLRVRIRGLDTKEKINRTLNRWVEGKKDKKSQITQVETVHNKDAPIETRVAKHLLKFNELRGVWLGTRMRTLR